MKFLKYDYLPNDCLVALKTYRYQGLDHSLLYKYIFSPIAESCLAITPSYLAPNLISVIGFACILFPHLIVYMIFGSNLYGDVPSWLLWLKCILHLFYMNLDNLDGKQARKTRNSTPLGMIIDHNLDALIVVLHSINLTTSIQFGNTLYSYFLYCIPAIPFYIISLEEYYTHVMDLPIINAAAEGVFSVGVMYGLTAYFGCKAWVQPVEWAYNLRVNQVAMIGFILFASIGTPLVYRNIKTKAATKINEAYRNTIPILLLVFGLLYTLIYSPTNIASTHMKCYMYIVGLNQSKLVGIIMHSHVTGDKLHLFRRSTFTMVGALVINILLYQITGNLLVNEATLVEIITVASFLCILIIKIQIYKKRSCTLVLQLLSLTQNPTWDRYIQDKQSK